MAILLEHHCTRVRCTVNDNNTITTCIDPLALLSYHVTVSPGHNDPAHCVVLSCQHILVAKCHSGWSAMVLNQQEKSVMTKRESLF